MNRRCCVMAALAGLGISAAVAEDPDATAPDAELLEFLGIWEGEDDDWSAFVDSLWPAGEPSPGDSEPDDGDFVDWSDAGESD